MNDNPDRSFKSLAYERNLPSSMIPSNPLRPKRQNDASGRPSPSQRAVLQQSSPNEFSEYENINYSHEIPGLPMSPPPPPPVAQYSRGNGNYEGPLVVETEAFSGVNPLASMKRSPAANPPALNRSRSRNSPAAPQREYQYQNVNPNDELVSDSNFSNAIDIENSALVDEQGLYFKDDTKLDLQYQQYPQENPQANIYSAETSPSFGVRQVSFQVESGESTGPPAMPNRAPSARMKSPERNSVKKSGGRDERPNAVRDTIGQREFKGKNPLQYALWAHFMGYGSSATCAFLGVIAVLWVGASSYGCKINGESINSLYTNNGPNNCSAIFINPDQEKHHICCNPKDTSSAIQGNFPIGLFYIAYGVFTLLYENTDWGFGMWLPSDSFFFEKKISPIGIMHVMAGIVGLSTYATCLAGIFLLTNGLVYCWAVYREESGDGGRAMRRKAIAAAKAKKEKEATETGDNCAYLCGAGFKYADLLQYNPLAFYRRIYNEDKLSSYVWVFIFIAGNALLYGFTFNSWQSTVNAMNRQLKDGTLDIACTTRLCAANRKAVRYGPFSAFVPIAKAFGNVLNLNGALILLPVIKMILRKLNNSGVSFSAAQRNSDYFGKFLAHPLTRYIPLSKNIDFHKMCAMAILVSAWGHMIAHYLNLITANAVTIELFRFAGSYPAQYILGGIVTYAMFFIFSAAPEVVRHSSYEIFFFAHHWFVVFFLVMFIHGPTFFYWTCLPVVLYIAERLLQLNRGNKPFLLVKVEWISPVMAIYFRPVLKEDFVHKEGQYLYLNCPAISSSEWHPFTISSAAEDLTNGPRIHLETGEEVVEVPRPANLPPTVKWNKYCLVSQNWRDLHPNEYLDRSETGYNDYVTVHVKVHGLDDPIAKTWTRRLKEYFELLSPGSKFPFYFTRRDPRGDVLVGKQYGPTGLQILRVDGPHSAPAEHYCNYGTVMLIGAGIGLTPCASILSSLTKYRWKKNFNPEILHFYWIVRQNELDSFQWLVHMLTDLSYELKRGKESGQVENRYYCEINIYVTGVEKTPKDVKPLYRSSRAALNYSSTQPTFTADELYAQLLNPSVESRGQIKKMRNPSAPNRLQDIWIWNGRPYWDDIFHYVKEQRQHSDIGVCFCGAPVIGADLREMCEKHSNVDEECLFSLHKENF